MLAAIHLTVHTNIFDNEKGSSLCRGENIQLIVDDRRIWLEHPGWYPQPKEGFRKVVDVGLLPLKGCLPDYPEIKDRIFAFSAHGLIEFDHAGTAVCFKPGYPRVASEVFILGFPQGLTMQGLMPVWKRASVATEPLFNAVDNDPVFLVDALTRPGMSGSPVLHFGGDITNEWGVLVPNNERVEEPWLVGVYAGREGVTGEEMDLTLGRVWHRELLDQIVMQPRTPQQR